MSDDREKAEKLVGLQRDRHGSYLPEERNVARAQVHAILALAAAVDRVADALAAKSPKDESDD